MALPVNPDPTDRRAAVLRMLDASPDGLSDAALAQALGDGTRPQTVNQLCRRLVAEGALERVGTRPILNRRPTPPTRRRGRKATAAPSASDPTPGAPPTELRARGTGSRRTGKATPPTSGRTAADVSTPAPHASETEASPAGEPAPAATRARSARTSVAAMTPTPNTSETEATPAAPPTPATTRSKSGRTTAEATTPTANASETEASAARRATPAPEDTPASAEAERRKQSTAESVAPEADAVRAEPAAEVLTPTTSQSGPEVPTCGPPPYDVLQAWSRVANVQALVADWLVRRGATLRSATLDGQGPTRDLVASLDGDDVHVEVTGWPADGARTHPTTIAGDWFSGAEQAAAQRRRAHPKARIVIALPDTRRYRSLTQQRATSLAGAGAEVWFVDPAGSVQAR
jgi:hypothetical protein